MAVRLFSQMMSLSLPATSAASSVGLFAPGPSGGPNVSSVRVVNASTSAAASVEAFVLFASASTVNVTIPTSVSSSTAGISILPGGTAGFEAGGALWVSAITLTGTANLRITQGDGGLT